MEPNKRCAVLVVEDDPSISQFVQSVLSDEGYDVQVAQDGEQALRQVDASPPDLVLLDLLLPGMDGATFLRELRQRTAAVRVAIMTAAREGEAGRVPVQAEGLLLKPFDLNTLLDEVERLTAEVECSH